jgi:hypothetical protein
VPDLRSIHSIFRREPFAAKQIVVGIWCGLGQVAMLLLGMLHGMSASHAVDGATTALFTFGVLVVAVVVAADEVTPAVSSASDDAKGVSVTVPSA